MKKILYTSCLLLAANFAVGQDRATLFQAYIESYSNIAIDKMREHGIPASITLAQGLLESGAGKSRLAVEANNHFGIKCHNWTGETIHHDDDALQECFRKYEHAEQSFEDHSTFLTTRQRYAFLFDLDKTDYRAWAQGLKDAGYATDPNYPQRLITIIEDFELYKYDKKFDETSKNTYLIDEKVENIPPKKETALNLEISDETVENQPTNKSGTRVFHSDKIIGQVNPYFAHEVKTNNGVRYVIASENASYESIADEFGLKVWEIYNINDAVNPSKLHGGEMVYIRQKKTASDRVSYHIVTEGETMRYIAQKHGIRLNALYKRNNMTEDSKPTIGQRIMLK